MAKHTQITQNNKFAISLQLLKKELSDEVDFLYADRHEGLLRLLGMEFISDMLINIKDSTSWYYHFGWKCLDMPKIPKIGSW